MKRDDKNKIISFSLIFILAAFCLSANYIQAVLAYTGLSVGTSTLTLGAGENLFYGNINSASDASSNFLLFKKDASTNLFEVGSDGGGYFMGNVGIATTSPQAALHVDGGMYVLGGDSDVNGDAPVSHLGNASDALLVRQYLTSQATLTPAQYARADVNADNRVDMLDENLIIQHFSSVITRAQMNHDVGRFIKDSNFYIDYGGNVGIGYGTSSPPAQKLAVFTGNSYALDVGSAKVTNLAPATEPADAARLSDVVTQVNAGFLATRTATMNMGGYDIINVGKLTVATVDPLYNIKGVNYSTYASSIAGGVKEECVGNIELSDYQPGFGYEYVIDFDKLNVGSDLWVWRQVVDFSPANVQVFLAASGNFAQTYYLINHNKIILRSDEPTVVSYRLVGKRFDWKSWPTKSRDQAEPASLIIK